MRIYALIGSSGTGKSHHAQFIAQEYHIKMIIDDGLLIEGSKILAGKSAKRSPTKVGAIKTALFSDNDHAGEVGEKLQEQMPPSILILGTSLGMVEKIAQRLKLPPPATIINIEDMVSTRDIRKARFARNRFGTHVIPAPTVEVKPKFSGSIIYPLLTLFKNRLPGNTPIQAKNLWVEQSVVRPTFNNLGKFFIANDVICQIVGYTCQGISGIVRTGKINVDNHEQGLSLHIDTHMKFGYRIPETITRAQCLIKKNIEQMTSLHIITIDMHVIKLVVENDS